MALPTDENTLSAWEPISRMVPTTIVRITPNITAYSAMSWPRSTLQKRSKTVKFFKQLPFPERLNKPTLALLPGEVNGTEVYANACTRKHLLVVLRRGRAPRCRFEGTG